MKNSATNYCLLFLALLGWGCNSEQGESNIASPPTPQFAYTDTSWVGYYLTGNCSNSQACELLQNSSGTYSNCSNCELMVGEYNDYTIVNPSPTSFANLDIALDGRHLQNDELNAYMDVNYPSNSYTILNNIVYLRKDTDKYFQEFEVLVGNSDTVGIIIANDIIGGTTTYNCLGTCPQGQGKCYPKMYRVSASVICPCQSHLCILQTDDSYL